VYNAHDDVVRCVASVRARTGGDYRLVLIDDGSTDTRIGDFFKQLESEVSERLVLLRNNRNLGFVGTANRGMQFGKGDVVLLNSDTIVTSGWLGRLQRCAASDSSIATVTPFSNNAEICSFPVFCRNNPIPEDPELVAAALGAAAMPRYPDIPTAVGFCMLIRRTVIERLGGFDEAFGRGYGEENDFCMRAARAGFRNVLCDDAYVVHAGGKSFTDAKASLTRSNIEVLLRRHPDYNLEIARFIERDPLRPMRQLAVSELAIRSTPRRGVLHIVHARGGGTEKYVRDLAQVTGEQLRHYVLFAINDDWTVEELGADGTLNVYRFRHEKNEVWATLLDGVCAHFHIDLCHVQHISGCRLGLLHALRKCTTPYLVSVHDFYLACPTINLLDESGRYCDAETDPVRCAECLRGQVDFAGVNIVQWRREHNALLSRAACVIAPSEAAAVIFRRYYAEVEVTVVPNVHLLSWKKLTGQPIAAFLLDRDACTNVAVVGAIGPVKGSANLRRLVERTRERGLPLRWVVVGYTDWQYEPWQSEDHVLTIHGPYQQRHLRTLLEHYAIDLAVFPSAGPETYCYTLSETWQAGLPALVPPLGALGERLRSTGAGWIMDDWQDVDAILDQVVALGGEPARAERAHRAHFAMGVSSEENQSSGAALCALYDARVARPVGPVVALALERVCDAATGKTELPRRWSRTRIWIRGLAVRALRFGARYRDTHLGGRLKQMLPLSWQYRLRRLIVRG
jgi:GT2 family glycosyltransferase/glycosyltransferase involved in cell wall biosynthesis